MSLGIVKEKRCLLGGVGELSRNILKNPSQLHDHLKKSDRGISVLYAKELITIFEELKSEFENVNVMMIVFTKILSRFIGARK